MTSPASWASFKVKMVDEARSFVWEQTALHIERNPKTGRHIVWLIDCIPFFEHGAFFRKIPKRSDRDRNLFLWHAVFTQEVLMKYDDSYWRISHLVRKFEKVS
jgi:hypothetical protein